MHTDKSGPTRRGRPPKFGRPARLVALTLPEDVVEWLRSKDADLSRAIVELFEASAHRHAAAPPRSLEAAIVEVDSGRGLILVDAALVHDVPGVATIPFSGGRAFLALEPGWSASDLELAVIDRLEAGMAAGQRYEALAAFRAQLRLWRSDPGLRLRPRSIIVVERKRVRRRAARQKP